MGVAGAFLIEPAILRDERGLVAHIFDASAFAAEGLHGTFPRALVACNDHAGTLRGLHYTRRPGEEVKTVRCTAGAVFDVILDLRADSPTYKRWASVDLSASNRRMVYVPAGVAHGYLTLQPASELSYQISSPHDPALDSGVRWDDPAFDIAWPRGVSTISDRDRAFARFRE